MQPARAIVQNKFKDGFGTAPKAFQAKGDNVPARGSSFPQAERCDCAKASPVLVTSRPMLEKFADRSQFEPGELLSPFGSNSANSR